MVRRAVLVVSLMTCASCTYDIPDVANDASTGYEAFGDGGSGGPDGTTDGGGSSGGAETGGTDSPSQADGACTGGVTCPCTSDSNCASKLLCATSAMVGSALAQQAGGSFCTTTCCTSAECPTGSVCFATGAGGSYCVAPSWLGRTGTGGTKLGGDSCSTGSDCWSGLCTGTTCIDTCCDFAAAGSECAGGRSCVFGKFPGAAIVDTNFAAFCAPKPGSGGLSASCTQSSGCQGGLCYPNTDPPAGPAYCTMPCRLSDACGQGASCEYDNLGANGIYFACLELGSTETTPFGGACTDYLECAGDICNANQCTNVCVTDQDCKAPLPHCRPQLTSFYGQPPNVWITMCTP
jgi:hypothetical protein